MFPKFVLSKRPVDVVFVVRNWNEGRMKRIKALLFLESNFCAEKQLLLFFISWGVIRNSEPAAEIVLPMLLFLLWNQERDWLERCVRLKVNLTLLALLLIITSFRTRVRVFFSKSNNVLKFYNIEIIWIYHSDAQNTIKSVINYCDPFNLNWSFCLDVHTETGKVFQFWVFNFGFWVFGIVRNSIKVGWKIESYHYV